MWVSLEASGAGGREPARKLCIQGVLGSGQRWQGLGGRQQGSWEMGGGAQGWGSEDRREVPKGQVCGHRDGALRTEME